jgi:dihydrodipicolinate synthase/N-acetylneuraminate lyase
VKVASEVVPVQEAGPSRAASAVSRGEPEAAAPSSARERKITSLRRFEKEGKVRRVSILTGNGGLLLDFEMERGGDGAMTGCGLPETLIDVVRLSHEGRREEAHDLLDAHLPLVRL